MKYCVHCGQQLNINDNFCNMCGKSQQIQNENFDVQEKQIKYASFGKRLGAFLIDSLIGVVIGFLVIIIGTVILIYKNSPSINNSNSILGTLSLISTFVGTLLIIFGQPILSFFGDKSKKHHASLGKRTMKIKIINENNMEVTTGQLFLRLIIKVFIPYSIIISLITVLATKKKQALQDMFLKEVVVEE